MRFHNKYFNIATAVILATTIAASITSLRVTALSNKGPSRLSLSERVSLSQGEASLLGSSTTFYNSQPLWSGKKNAEKDSFQVKNEDKSKSYTLRTSINKSSFTPKKPS